MRIAALAVLTLSSPFLVRAPAGPGPASGGARPAVRAAAAVRAGPGAGAQREGPALLPERQRPLGDPARSGACWCRPLLLFTGLSARMRDAAREVGRNWFFTVAVYGILFTLVTFLLDLPLAYYAGFVRQHAYGLSDQTAAKWWSDALNGARPSAASSPPSPLGPLPAAAQEPAALVALHGPRRRSRCWPSSCSSRRSGSSRCSTSSGR